jgi:hypothetical protein
MSTNPPIPEPLNPAALRPLYDRIQNYLGNGGLFNPEMMEHDKVRSLLMDIRDTIHAASIATPPPPSQRERELVGTLSELRALVKGECPSLLNEDSGGGAKLDMRIDAALQAYAEPAAGTDYNCPPVQDKPENVAFVEEQHAAWQAKQSQPPAPTASDNPQPPPPRLFTIKPLVWVDEIYCSHATSFFWKYFAYPDGRYWPYQAEGFGKSSSPTLESSKADCQTDYEERLSEALEPWNGEGK